MYKILVVDDEILICDHIAYTIREILGERCIVSTAGDGIEAVKLHEVHNFDIIVTDIRMAVKNGLDAIAEISQKENNNTSFIIISGHSEFEYAQRAIELKVVKYLLKPVNRLELEHALIKAISQTRSHEQELKTREMLREQALQQLISQKIDAVEAIAKLGEEHNLYLSKACFTIMTVDLQLPRLFESSSEEGIQASIRKLFYENFLLDNTRYGIFFDNLSRIVVVANSDIPLEIPHITHAFSILCRNLINYYNLSNIKMGASRSLPSPTSLPALYEQSLGALEYKILYSGSAIIFYQEIKEKKLDTPLFNLDTSRLTSAIESNDKKTLSELIEALFEPSRISCHTIENIRLAFDALLNHIFVQIVNPNPDLRCQSKINEFFLTKFQQYNSLNEIVVNLKKFVFLLCDEINRNTVPAGNLENFAINQALQYIRKNYNKNITMASVANHVCLSYNHFSKLFKESTGENFIDYMTHLRMEKAKELLMNPVLDISDISTMTGYSSPRHFSRVFLQHIGKLPRDFRKSSGKTSH